MRPTLDVIIPCYNSAATLQAAVESAVSQPAVENVWLIDDASIDDTRLIMSDLTAIHPKVRCEYMLENGGAAKPQLGRHAKPSRLHRLPRRRRRL